MGLETAKFWERISPLQARSSNFEQHTSEIAGDLGPERADAQAEMTESGLAEQDVVWLALQERRRAHEETFGSVRVYRVKWEQS